MRISLVQIETFYWVARLGSFHAAARHQHLSQPSVSARIHELEEALRCKLFERSAAGAILTSAGRTQLARAEHLLQIVDDMLEAPYLPMRGVFRVGANESAALTGLTSFLQALRMAYPGLNIQLTVDVGAGVRDKLAAGAIDFSISTNPAARPHIVDVLLGTSPMAWVAQRGRMAPAQAWRAEALLCAPVPVMAMPEPSSLHQLTVSWFAKEGIVSPPLSTSTSLAMMSRLVAAGLAISILPPAILKSELASGQIDVLDVAQPVPGLALYASFPKGGNEARMQEIAQLARAEFVAAELIVPALPGRGRHGA